MADYAVMIQTDPDDRFFTESILHENGINRNIIFVKNVEELIALQQKKGDPVVILINDNAISPAATVLSQLKKDETTVHLPVVVLGEIITKDLMTNYYRNGASSYITKPATIQESAEKISTFFKYWFEVAG